MNIVCFGANLNFNVKELVSPIGGPDVKKSPSLQGKILVKIGVNNFEMDDGVRAAEAENGINKFAKAKLVLLSSEHDFKKNVVEQPCTGPL